MSVVACFLGGGVPLRSVKVALVQMRVTEDKERNLRSAADAVRRAADAGAQVVCLPEMFACQYENHSFIENQEEAGGKIWQTLSAIARENHVILIGGSFPESDGGRLYNSCFIFDENGQQIGRHRKVHLFDVDVAANGFDAIIPEMLSGLPDLLIAVVVILVLSA